MPEGGIKKKQTEQHTLEIAQMSVCHVAVRRYRSDRYEQHFSSFWEGEKQEHHKSFKRIEESSRTRLAALQNSLMSHLHTLNASMTERETKCH